MSRFSEILVQAENSLCARCHMLNAGGNILTIEEFQKKFKIKTNYFLLPSMKFCHSIGLRSVHTTLEKFENAALFLRLGLTSTLIRQENAFYNNCRNSRATWLIFIVNKRRDTWIYNLCHVVLQKTSWRQFFIRLFCYWQWISIHSYFDNVMTRFTINNWTDAWKPGVDLLTSNRRNLKTAALSYSVDGEHFENEASSR